MKEVRVRLLYPASVKPEEVGAALRGMERFRTYGVLHDSAGLRGNDKEALRGVSNGKTMKRLVTSPELVMSPVDLHVDVVGMLFKRDIIPVGLTPVRMNELVGEEFSVKKEPRLGLSRGGIGAIVSLFKPREMETASTDASVPVYRNGMDSGIALKSIELAVMHELGHVFGVQGHCENKGCLMQANENFADFIDRFVIPGVNFCRNCSSTISCAVNRMIAPF